MIDAATGEELDILSEGDYIGEIVLIELRATERKRVPYLAVKLKLANDRLIWATVFGSQNLLRMLYIAREHLVGTLVKMKVEHKTFEEKTIAVANIEGSAT